MTRVGVVDDDLDFQQLIQDIVREFGWTSMSCTSAHAAYTALSMSPPDVVLLDIRIEQTYSGWDVLTFMQMQPVLSQVPVIVCSAMADELAAKRKWLTVHDIQTLSKPFDVDDLLAMLSLAMVSRSALSYAV